MESSFPRIFSICSSASVTRSLPSKRIFPFVIRPTGSGSSRITERAVTVFPHPDSPTIPNISSLLKEKSIESRTFNTPSSVKKQVSSCLILRISSSMGELPSEFRVCHVPHPIAEHVEGQDGNQNGDAGENPEPRGIFQV